MTSAWFLGATHAVSQDENEVRSTLEPIRNDGPPEMDSPPEFNEFESDDSGELVGLSPRMVGSDLTPIEKYRPEWLDQASYLHNPIIDSQVASSGTAAKREEAGQSGHGTMQYSQALEPVIRDGAAFGNDYFAVNDKVVQEGAGSYMQPSGSENDWASAVAASAARANSRSAYQGSQYSALMGY